MKLTNVQRPHYFKSHAGFWSRVVDAKFMLIPILLSFTANAQDSIDIRSEDRPLTRLGLANTACFLPGNNVSFHGENSVFLDIPSNGPMHGSVQLSLLERIQLEISNEGTVARSFADIHSLPMWAMKLRIFEAADKRTIVSALIRTSLSGERTDSWPNQIGSSIQRSPQNGLLEYSHDYTFAFAEMLVSSELDNSISFHAGLEIQQIQINNVKLKEFPPELGLNDIWEHIINRQYGLNGFLGLAVRASRVLIVFGELQSLPELALPDGHTTIDVLRGYRTELGIRYQVRKSLAILANAQHLFLPVGSGYTEMRVGAEATVSLQ